MKVRRVVTTNDSEGKSSVKWDSQVEAVPGRKGLARFPMWATKRLPAELTEEDPGKWEHGITIGGGSVFRLVRYEPGCAERWHQTDSIDYAIVVSGEIDLQLDKEEVHLKTGDVVIQRGTLHNWVNCGSEPCLILFVLIST
ncbi:cupin domain-containing protein [Chloroflexota bacterium]